MKKENRKLAQEKRAAERAKAAEMQKRKKQLKIAVPVIIVLLLVAVLIADTFRSSDSGSSTETENVSDTFQTDASLTVQDGDMLYIDYVGTIDGVEFEGGNTQGGGAYLVIGSGSYIDDFEEQLIGSHPGDVVNVEVTFPDDYTQADLAGKDAVFEVTVHGIFN